jgi:DNA-directed RNA polymerase specialized sigma24 family protein
MDSIKTFCEFPSLGESQDYLTWHRDPRLVRYLRGLDDRSAVQIAEVLVSRILTEPMDKLACACITALLAHILFSTSGRAKIRSQIFQPLQYHSTQIELADIYQIALDLISQPANFLANFQPDATNWYGSLVRYSSYRFDRLLIDRIRSLPDLSGFKRTNLGLLARTSPRRMKAALVEQGERDLRLQQLLSLHQCLVDTIAVDEFDTRNPQPVHYDNLSARYNQQCDRVELAIADRATLIQLVKYMGTAIRNYIQPPTDTLDRSVDPHDAQSRTLIDLIPDPRDCHHQLESDIFTQTAIALSNELPIDSDRILMFFYGLELTQIEVGIELDCNQSTAKRRRDRCLERSVKDLSTKIWETSDLSLELLNAILDRVELVYEDLYAELLLAIFELIVAESSSIASKLNVAAVFIDRLERKWQFKFKPDRGGLTKARAFVALRSD